MTTDPRGIAWGGRVLRAPVPAGRDPFVNTPLTALTADAEGMERFWTSSCNRNSGSTGVLVDEVGRCRLYHFEPGLHSSFYSACQEDDRTLWLCGNLSRVVRLDLDSGRYETFETGAPPALVFAGMVFDPPTGRLFAAAHVRPEVGGFTFDVRDRKTVELHSDVCADCYMRSSFANGEGTYTIVLHCPGLTFLRWDPRDGSIELRRVRDRLDLHAEGGLLYTLVGDDHGRRYAPTLGWYDPAEGTFDPTGPRPEKEMTWFARAGRTVFGAAEGVFAAWDLSTGHVRSICTMPDARAMGARVTAAGKLVCVDIYGVFRRYDTATGALECSRRLPTDAVGPVDCLVRIDSRRLLGTPFITQRFWEVDLQTGRGFDCGRAAPGGGEILKTWKIGEKVFLAAYAGGELLEYDPAEHAHFPENPRVVADPPEGMRPVAAADDGQNIYYACSAEYGTLGSVLTRYDTGTGLAAYAPHPLGDQQIRSLVFDARSRTLLAGTTMNADCASAPPSEDVCWIARIRADDLSVVEKFSLPAGATTAAVIGPLAPGQWLCTLDMVRWWALRDDDFRLPGEADLRTLPDGLRTILYAGRPGRFVLHAEDRVELWDPAGTGRSDPLARDADIYKVLVQDDSVYLVYPREIVVLAGCLDESAHPEGQ